MSFAGRETEEIKARICALRENSDEELSALLVALIYVISESADKCPCEMTYILRDAAWEMHLAWDELQREMGSA